ncbi:MAG: site-2 protease family protein [Verrucomicrobia bacterium]|nr:site-2 protease family protein [Verrucomicrobiota bacterium]
MNLVYILLAIAGLGLLVFIHELGHYFAARWVGMRVEAFGIGFGKPIYTWLHKGVKWNLCMLPFGGYVKIAGMQKEGVLEPSEIPDGFFGKSPAKRIFVALAGPLVNIIFAMLVFCALWLAGGRTKTFSEYTHRIGWVEPNSTLYANGVRPGDFIQKYDGHPYNGIKDLLIASAMENPTTRIEGYKIDYETGSHSHFDYTLKNSEDPSRDLRTIGVAEPASYLIYNERGVPDGAPILSSGIKAGDRIVWADGEVLFSIRQLSSVLNDSTVFITARRGNEVFHTKVPRVHLDELKISSYEKAEIDDWQHEANIKAKLADLWFVPYSLSPTCGIESRLAFIDDLDQKKAFQTCDRCSYFNPLQEGDVILAVNSHPVQNSYEFLQWMQVRETLLIVERDPAPAQIPQWTDADRQFDDFKPSDLRALVSRIGTDEPLTASGNLYFLNPIVPLPYREMPLSEEIKTNFARELDKQRKEIEAIKDTQQKETALKQFESQQNRLVLGAALQDRNVIYNPTPMQQFSDVLSDTWRTLTGLFSGNLSPKYVSGPVGIVRVVHYSWSLGLSEASYWMAVISLSLGLINLLPLPVLDGGHIVFSVVEMFTRKPIKAKTMERLVIPFVGLLIVFFIYITYQDISRFFGK